MAQADFLWSLWNEAIYPARGWALSPAQGDSLGWSTAGPSAGLPLPQHRCGTACRSQQGHSIGICARGFSNRLFSQQRLIPQVCKGRVALNCSLGRTKEGNTSKISFCITSSVSQSCYPADVESFVFLLVSGWGGQTAKVTKQTHGLVHVWSEVCAPSRSH